MGKLFWLPTLAFLLNINDVNKKPESYPFVPVEMAKLAVEKGYPIKDAVLDKFHLNFHSNFVILSYQELIDWFRDQKDLHITIQLDTFSRCNSGAGMYVYSIRNTVTLQPIVGKWRVYDNYYEAQHNAIMETFKLINNEPDSLHK